MQGTKRKRIGSDFTRNVRPRAQSMLLSILEIGDIFGEIMNKLIQPIKQHQTQYKECTEMGCYCHFAFAFTSLSMASKSTYEVCNNYKNAYTHKTKAKNIPIDAFKMPPDVWCVYAATYGYLEVMKYARVVLKAPWFGHVHAWSFGVDKFSVIRGCPCEFEVAFIAPKTVGSWLATSNASKHGHRDCLEYAFLNGCPYEDGITHAAREGHTECVRFYLESVESNNIRYPIYDQISNALEEAILGNNMECINLLISHTPMVSECAIHKCAQVGNIETTKKIAQRYNHENSIPKTATLCAAVSRDSADNLSYLKWLTETYQVVITTQVANKAAFRGSLRCLQFLVSKGVLLDESVTKSAAANGQLECLKYLHSVGCRWDAKTTKAASAAKSLECLKYAYENGCPMHEDAGYVALDLECLRYAHEHGSIWNENFMCETMHYGKEVVPLIEYALDNGCPVDTSDCDLAASIGELEILKCLHERGCPWDGHATRAALESYKEGQKGALECLTYLIQNGCPMPKE